jgi:hypothetical protein
MDADTLFSSPPTVGQDGGVCAGSTVLAGAAVALIDIDVTVAVQCEACGTLLHVALGRVFHDEVVLANAIREAGNTCALISVE